MDSLDDILSRVLQNASEKVAQRVQPALNRRPLRDPENPSAVLQSVSAAMASIRSPETAAAMARAVRDSNSARFASPEEVEDFNNGGFGIPAEHHRKTTIADDANVLGTVGATGSAIVSQIASAGRALSGIPDAANSFREAVSEMADSASSAAPVIDSVSGPLSKMASAIVSQISGMGSKVARGTGSTAESAADGSGNSGAFQRIPKAPKSFAAWFGDDESQSAGKGSGSAQTWLESSSIADSVRDMVNNVGHSMQKLQSNMVGLITGGLAASGGMTGGTSVQGGPSLSGRLGDSFDRMLARSFSMFRSMSAGASGGGSGGSGGGDDGNPPDSPSTGFGMFRGIRNQIRGRIGNAGRRMMAGYFRRGISRGRRLLRGGAGGGGGGGRIPPIGAGVAAGTGGGGLGLPIGTGLAAGAAGAGGGGGGAAAGAAAGGAGAGGAVMGGLVLGGLALVAVIGIAISGLMKLGKQGYETALRVAHLDGVLTAAKAQLEVSRLLRDIQTARTLSAAGAGHMDALNRLEENIRPITDGAMLVGLYALTGGLEMVNLALGGLKSASLGLIRSFNAIDNAIGMNMIDDKALKEFEERFMGKKAPANILAAPLHEMFVNMPPAAPPRPPIPPIGGNN